MGEERGGKLVYAGKIESGWTEDEKKQLLAEVQPLQRRTPAIELATDKPKARWVEPRVLVDVEYRAKTDKSRLLRHPRFKGLRRDLMEPTRKGRGSRQRIADSWNVLRNVSTPDCRADYESGFVRFGPRLQEAVAMANRGLARPVIQRPGPLPHSFAPSLSVAPGRLGR